MAKKTSSNGATHSSAASYGSYDTTIVLNCTDCEPDSVSLQPENLGGHLRVLAASWRIILSNRDAVVLPPEFMGTDRLSWSVNSYGAHVRDLAELTYRRITAIITSEDPLILRRWDPAKAARNGKYETADPRIVSYSLARIFGQLADTLERLNTEDWCRKATMVDGVAVTVESLARACVHHIEHHHYEAEKALHLAG